MNATAKYVLAAAAVVCGFLLFSATPAVAQVTTGNIIGTVTDQQGGVLPGVTVVATHVPTGTVYKSVTDKDGRFQMLEVRVGGPYTVVATLQGFKDGDARGFNVKLGEDHPVDFKLEIQTVNEVVTVGESPIDVSQSGSSSNITQLQLQSVPTIARNIFDIVQSNPYFSGYNAKGNGQLSLSIAGRNNRYNNIQIDGAANNDLFGLSDSGTPEGQAGAQPISLDSIQEFQLLVSPYDVRQGGFSGGGLNIVTRSGSNTFGGDGFVYGRNQGWVGKYFNPNLAVTDPNTGATTVGNDAAKVGQFSDKQLGGSLGGPVMKNKAFFFFTEDSQRQQTPAGVSADGTGGAPFAQSALGANAQASVQSIVDTLESKYNYNPAGTSGLDPLGNFTKLTNSDKIFARVDMNLSPTQRLTIRNNYVDSVADSGTATQSAFMFPDNYVRFHIKTNSTVAQLNSTFGGNMVNELRLAGTEIRNRRGGEPFEQSPFPQFTINLAPGTTVVGGRDRSSTANQLFQDDIELNDDLTLVRGQHTITVGTHDEFFHFRDLFIQNTFGTYTFTNASSNGLANFQSGVAQAYSFNFSNTGNPLQQADFRVAQFGAYVGDQWRPSSRLTVTAGVRVDAPRFNHAPNPTTQTILDLFGRRTDVTPSPTQWSPRVGFNWDPVGNGKQQLRGGIGIFSGRTPYVWIANQYTNNGVDFSAISISTNSNNKIPFIADPNAQTATPTGGTLTTAKQTLNFIDPNFKFPSQLRGNIAYDTNLPWGLVGRGEFMFNKTIEDVLYQNLNDLPTGATSNLDGRPLFNGTALSTAVGPAILLTNTTQGHGWNVSYDVSRTFRNDLGFEASYSYGRQKTLEESESSVALTSWQNVYSITPNSPVLTTSDFDPGHRVAANVSYSVPVSHGLRALLSLMYVGQSGHPYTLSYSFDVNGDTQSFNDNLYLLPPSQANAVTFSSSNGNGNYQTLADFFSSLGSCVTNQIGSIYVRNSCRAPWTNNLNARIAVRLPFKSVKTDVTLDILNLLNLLNDHWGLQKFVNFNQIDLVNPFSTAGQITRLDLTSIDPKIPGTFAPFSIDDLRSRWQMQLGVRVVF